MAATRSMAAELVRWGIRVNALSPGTVDTDMVRKNAPEAQAEMTRIQLMQRMAHPDEMVGPALLLTPDAGSFITGHVIFADGGMVPRQGKPSCAGYTERKRIAPSSAFPFTKPVVADLERMAAFYCAVYRLQQTSELRPSTAALLEKLEVDPRERRHAIAKNARISRLLIHNLAGRFSSNPPDFGANVYLERRLRRQSRGRGHCARRAEGAAALDTAAQAWL